MSLRKRKPRTRRSAAGGSRHTAAAGGYVFGVDPKLVVTGADGYPAGLPLDDYLIGEMFKKECQDVTPFRVVEIARRAELIEEIERSHSPYFDKRTAVPRGHLLEPRQWIKGGGKIAGGRFSISVQIVDLGSGEQIASAAVEGPGDEFFELLDLLTTRLMDDLCSARVDVTFSGSGAYQRDEGTADTTGEHHVRGTLDWTTTYRNVKLAADANLTLGATSSVTGQWSDDGRFGAAGPGSFRCSGPAVGSGGEFASLKVERTADGFRLATWPFFLAQPDPLQTSCTGLPGAPYESFFLSGTEPAIQAIVDVNPAGLGAGPLAVAVGPTAPFPEGCEALPGEHHHPCRQTFSWSGRVTVTRAGRG